MSHDSDSDEDTFDPDVAMAIATAEDDDSSAFMCVSLGVAAIEADRSMRPRRGIPSS